MNGKNEIMAEITIKYDAKNSIAKKALEVFLSLGLFEVTEKEECPYDKEFMEKLEKSKKSKNDKAIPLEDLWK